jgi:D-3-phosphoglycerate dehydrogenase
VCSSDLIAGTEPITEKVMKRASKLKLISRVGIGLDSVDLLSAQKRGIKVSYTPDAPAPAVSELTLGLMLCLLRSVHVSNSQIHKGNWYRYFGRRLEEVTVGIIGVGRIGTRVIKLLKGFSTSKILVNDIFPNSELDSEFKLEWTSKEKIYQDSDIISLHLPLTHLTKNMIKNTPGFHSVGELESGKLSLLGESISATGDLVLASSCPACNHNYEESVEQLCPSCGSTRPLVEV